jgi:hypothetical protein
VSAIPVRRETLCLVTIRERLYGIMEGLKRTEQDTLTGSLDSASGVGRREEYLRRVLRDAIAREAISISAMAGRLDALCGPAEVA